MIIILHFNKWSIYVVVRAMNNNIGYREIIFSCVPYMIWRYTWIFIKKSWNQSFYIFIIFFIFIKIFIKCNTPFFIFRRITEFFRFWIPIKRFTWVPLQCDPLGSLGIPLMGSLPWDPLDSPGVLTWDPLGSPPSWPFGSTKFKNKMGIIIN